MVTCFYKKDVATPAHPYQPKTKPNMKMKKSIIIGLATLATVGSAMAQLVQHQPVACYGLDINPFRPTSISSVPTTIKVGFKSAVLISGSPVLGNSISGGFLFDIFGTPGNPINYDGSIPGSFPAGNLNPFPNGGITVGGYAAGNINPNNVKIEQLHDPYYVCGADVQTWTIITDKELNAAIERIEQERLKVFVGNGDGRTPNVVLLDYSDKIRGNNGYIYRVSGEDSQRLRPLDPYNYYVSKDGGRTMTLLAKGNQKNTTTMFSDFQVCICKVPEPSSTALLGLGGLALLLRRRR